jgi:hypothetical protein
MILEKHREYCSDYPNKQKQQKTIRSRPTYGRQETEITENRQLRTDYRQPTTDT